MGVCECMAEAGRAGAVLRGLVRGAGVFVWCLPAKKERERFPAKTFSPQTPSLSLSLSHSSSPLSFFYPLVHSLLPFFLLTWPPTRKQQSSFSSSGLSAAKSPLRPSSTATPIHLQYSGSKSRQKAMQPYKLPAKKRANQIQRWFTGPFGSWLYKKGMLAGDSLMWSSPRG